jgi:phosphatidylinositol alpha-1,6-mannosyltransferase|tara:strand:- start:583 stop:1674 length:1092 start_codon:yes stop_codon:yes gene_type:complete
MFVIATRNFPPDIGGIQNLMEGLSNALVDHGPVKVFADESKNCKIYDKNSKLNTLRISGFKIFKKYRKANLISSFLNENSVRAIFFDHWKSVENIDENALKNIPSFCLIHSKEINHPLDTNLNKRMRRSLSKVTYVIANSSFTKNLASKHGVEKENIKIINPGCNYPVEVKGSFKEQAKNIFKDSFPKIITIARLDKRKSHQNILMCIKNLKPIFPKIRYVCIGDGDEKDNLEKLKIELNLKDEIVFLKNTSEELKVALLNHSNLFLMPSVIYKKSVEGFGISFIEAASYGKGSIGGNLGGEQDSIKHGTTGYICDGNDLTAIYESVLKFFKDDNYKKLGLNALEFSKGFKWKIIIKKYLDLI